jgi:hypothetical protein
LRMTNNKHQHPHKPRQRRRPSRYRDGHLMWVYQRSPASQLGPPWLSRQTFHDSVIVSHIAGILLDQNRYR